MQEKHPFTKISYRAADESYNARKITLGKGTGEKERHQKQEPRKKVTPAIKRRQQESRPNLEGDQVAESDVGREGGEISGQDRQGTKYASHLQGRGALKEVEKKVKKSKTIRQGVRKKPGAGGFP